MSKDSEKQNNNSTNHTPIDNSPTTSSDISPFLHSDSVFLQQYSPPSSPQRSTHPTPFLTPHLLSISTLKPFFPSPLDLNKTSSKQSDAPLQTHASQSSSPNPSYLERHLKKVKTAPDLSNLYR